MANQINLEFRLSDDWVIDFDLNDESNKDIDLQGGTVDFRVSLDGVEILTLSSADSPSYISIDSPTTGTGSIVVTEAFQSDFTPGFYDYEIQARLVDSRVTTQVFGKLSIIASLFWPIST